MGARVSEFFSEDPNQIKKDISFIGRGGELGLDC